MSSDRIGRLDVSVAAALPTSRFVIGTQAARLGPADMAELDAFLGRDPVATVYLRSERRFARPEAQWWGVANTNELTAVVLAGALAVPWIPRVGDAGVVADGLQHAGLPRMLVGHRGSVMALHGALTPPRRARQIRDPQRVLVHDGGGLAEASTGVRRATRADLEPLIVSAAAMHREEMGIDPLAVDALAWRARMVNLVDRSWSWIWIEGGEIIFKTELSAWTPECAQLQGVYVAPRHRGKGIGRAGLAAVMRDVFATTTTCALYVNHYNVAALRLYAQLGFRHEGDFATVIY